MFISLHQHGHGLMMTHLCTTFTMHWDALIDNDSAWQQTEDSMMKHKEFDGLNLMCCQLNVLNHYMCLTVWYKLQNICASLYMVNSFASVRISDLQGYAQSLQGLTLHILHVQLRRIHGSDNTPTKLLIYINSISIRGPVVWEGW